MACIHWVVNISTDHLVPLLADVFLPYPYDTSLVLILEVSYESSTLILIPSSKYSIYLSPDVRIISSSGLIDTKISPSPPYPSTSYC